MAANLDSVKLMPVKSPPRERQFIEMLLSAYEGGMWKDAVRDWVEERQDGGAAGD
jgi:hypothetical protein